MKQAVRIAITGAAGHISYALLFRIARGDLLGPDQPVILQLLEIPVAMDALHGVVMELEDCAFPLLQEIVATDNAEIAFGDAQYALLVGAKPRGPGMERKDLLQDNAKIFSAQGKALNVAADRDIKVLVVGNPANTNALIAQSNAPNLPRGNFTAMTRLDHNRALSQLASKISVHAADIKQLIIWGNHSATQYPDIHHATVNGQPALDLVDREWSGDHQGARGLECGLRSLGRDRPHAYMGDGQRWRRLGEHGDPQRRQLWHRRRYRVFVSGAVQRRRLRDRTGLGKRRLQ